MENKTLYDSFNARYLDYNEIAELFIVNSQYLDLIKNNHSLLMGPRGSGKTTLLKMLAMPAQYFYRLKHPKDNETIDPPFFAIYIPTDVHWKKQMDDFEDEFKDRQAYKSIITRLIVATNVIISTCQTFIHLLEFREKTEDGLRKEAELAQQLIIDWKLKKPIAANLWSIKHSLLSRLGEINNHIKKVRTLKIKETDIEYAEYFYDEFLDNVTLGCDAFENIFKDDLYFSNLNFKWALCFDELEIAPNWLQFELLSLLRSLSNQKLLFKLTMVPLVMIDNKNGELVEITAREGQDFSIIRTWTYSQTSINNWESFSRKLIQDKFRRNNVKINPVTLFGADSLDRNIEITFSNEDNFKSKRGYTEGSSIWFLFKELSIIDSTFRDFLKNNNISPSNPIPNHEGQKDSIFRKVKPLALHRYQFKSHIIGRMRSRKNPSLYYGLPKLYNICDGNPRALIGLIDEFIEKLVIELDGTTKPLDINFQSRIISEVSKKYLLLLQNHPDANIPYYNKYMNLGIILEKIGRYFEERIIVDRFSMDPINCFVVDKDTPQEVTDLLKVAMHLGAIIYLNPDESVSKTSLVGKKFRLSYLLFPNYRLPIVEYNHTALSKILRKGTDKIDQLLLFETQ